MSGLISRNIIVNGRRTTTKLEAPLWEALEMIARRKGMTVNDVCTHVANNTRGGGFTSSLRVFIVEEMRKIASQCGSRR